MKKYILLMAIIFISGNISAQWSAEKLGTGGKYRAVSNSSAYLSKSADSVFAALSYIVNLDSLSNDTRIDSIKAILARLETSLNTARTTLTSIDGKDYATAANQTTANNSLSSIDSKLNNITTNTNTASYLSTSTITLSGTAAAPIGSQTIKEMEIYVPAGVSGYWGYSSAVCNKPLIAGTYIKININNSSAIYFKGSGTIYADLKN